MVELINLSYNIIRIKTFQKIILFQLCLIFFSHSGNSQNYNLLNIDFQVDGVSLKNPFVGGFTAPQLSKIDLNMDGIEDLLVFDRRGELARTFINSGAVGDQSYRHQPQYQKVLPRLLSFAKVIDYNQDGVPDIFTGAEGVSSIIAVYTGSWDGQSLSFSRFQNPHFIEDILTIEINGGISPIYSRSADIPAIVDVDFDGDIDILSFDTAGATVVFYKNLAVEKDLPLDSLDFILADACWGRFKEAGLSNQLFLSDSVNNCASEGIIDDLILEERHAGSTLEAFDYNNDGDIDLLIGDLLSKNLALVINEKVGSTDFIVDTINKFPNTSEIVDFEIFNSAFILDVDNDGLKDMVACPNSESNATNIKNFWFYKNVGGEENTNFSLVKKDFLNESTLDLGTDSSPAFLDYNQDGLIDILVGTSGEVGSLGEFDRVSLNLFENIGTVTQPKYSLVDDDYLDFSENSMFSINPTPAVGDLDGDGDDDILVGDVDGKLYYYENDAGTDQIYSFKQAVYLYMGIDPGAVIEPYIFDYNQDGLGDIIIGEKANNQGEFGFGNVNYYQNTGSIGNPAFESSSDDLPNVPAFGYINTKLELNDAGYSDPSLVDLAGNLFVISGSYQGDIHVFEGVYGDPDQTFPKLFSMLGGIQEGEQTSQDIADIDGDGYLELVIGNKRGGIAIYNTEMNLNGAVGIFETALDPQIKIFPNPNNGILNVHSNFKFENYQLFNIYGSLVETKRLESQIINIEQLPQGIYFLSLEFEGRTFVQKIIKN